MKKLIALLCFWFLLTGAVSFASGIQVDCLISGLRNPLTDSFLNGGLVYTYSAGTTASKSLYMDAALTTASTNPIVLDAYGRALRFAKGKYKFVFKTSGGTLLWTLDNLEYDSVATLASKTANPFGPTMSVTNFSTPNLIATAAANFSMNGYKITNLATPTSAYDAANMQYVASEVAYLNLTIATYTASFTLTLATVTTNINAGLATVTAQIASLTLPAPTVTASTTSAMDSHALLVGSGTWVPVDNFSYTNSSSENEYLHVSMRGDLYMAVLEGVATDTLSYCLISLIDNTTSVIYDYSQPVYAGYGLTCSSRSKFSLDAYVMVTPGETKVLNLSYKDFHGTAGSIDLLTDERWLSWRRVK